MEKTLILTALFIAFSTAAFSQKDPTAKDTVKVPVPVYIFEISDTVEVTIVFLAAGGTVMHSPGKVILKGQQTKNEKGEMVWITEPKQQIIWAQKVKPEDIIQFIPKRKK